MFVRIFEANFKNLILETLMKGTFSSFYNPIEWYKAYKFNKANSKYDKSQYDLELFLYSKILKNDMLHFGYFKDTNVKAETISIEQIEVAQLEYAQNIISQISNKKDYVLDVGCGMGGLAKLMLDKKLKVEVLTPNKNQIEYISKKYESIVGYNCKFEEFESTKKYGTIINSESLQYIKLDDAFKKIDAYLLPNGKWIVVDFFRLNDMGINRSGHYLDVFKEKVSNFGWDIVVEQDITLNVLPTLSFANMYLERFLLPLKYFAFEKLRYKKAWLFYLTTKLRESIEHKINKESAAISVDKFLNEKKYMLFVLEKKI